MKSSREAAFEILLKIHKDKAYSNLALDASLDGGKFSPVERGFISALVYGVTERIITLDYQLSKYLSQPLKKLKPQVLVILRMGAYQLLFMDKIPVSAAVNESVKLTKSCGCAFASGLVNAVLRKVAKNGLVLPENADEISRASIEYSCPKWILDRWKKDYGKENAINIAKNTVGAVETVLRVNTLKTDTESLVSLLSDEGVDAKEGSVENSVVISKAGSLRDLTAYKDGLFHVQDVASQLCCKALDAKEGERVLDICSAPGGKAFTTAQYMKNHGEIVACDIYEGRLHLIDSGAERLSIDIITTKENDASILNSDLGEFDKIICDVPCAGLGVIRRKPEIKFKSMAEVDKLPEIQYAILNIASKYLKLGGVLIYSTCSLNKDENENIFYRFLKENPDFEPVKVLPDVKRAGEQGDTLTLMPHLHNSDGFFISALRRRKSN
ncbi:MAG: 16S rRNA (cytosine(967)-C(5))-methyltransferase RsmB [Clostridia bacterium]|nr:16S rRNA (cytosine(967)-C(5))-methyltransferase RsmB [Clostridia bacterium]